MTADYHAFSEQVKRLDRAVACLTPAAAALGAPAAEGSEWLELLRQKLVAQLELPPLLVVAVVGGTNIGKSAIFNQLAGEVASAVSPLAAGTKHPVCLAPRGADDPQSLSQFFPTFSLCRWSSADDPLRENDENQMFWRSGEKLPERLLLIDAPDVDSNALVNWERARAVRQASDVLLAVLTQQKYNDAAVKQYFRAAVEADKPIVVVFNQVDLAADRSFWPQWLETFCEATGAKPELVCVVPHNRRAAEGLTLPFFSVGADGRHTLQGPINLRDELGALRFDEIKIRTFGGALDCVLDLASGAPAWLASIRTASGRFGAAADALGARELARVAWPSLPAGVLVEEIRQWWDVGRANWSRKIHGFYRTLGRGAVWPIRAVIERVAGPAVDPLTAFYEKERAAILLAVEKLLDELERLAEVGNETLRPRLRRLLGGDARAKLLKAVACAHEELPAVDDDCRTLLRGELDAWREASPKAVHFLQSLDHAAAVARPAISVTLFFTGLHLAGDLVGQAAVHAAGHTVGQVATEAAIAGGFTGGSEALLSTTSEGVRQAAGRLFVRLQSQYARRRAEWLAVWLEGELLGELLGDLRRGGEVPQSAEFRAVETSLDALQEFSVRSRNTMPSP